MLPSFQYADRHITIRTNAKWKPDRPELKKREVRLRHPDPEILEMIIAEKDEAVALADRALHHLSQARPHLKGEDYDDLFFRLHRLRRTAEVWRLHAEAFFGYKVLAEAHRVEGLRERVIRALDGLDRQAEVSKQIGIVESRDPPAAAETIRAVAAELREMVEALGEQ